MLHNQHPHHIWTNVSPSVRIYESLQNHHNLALGHAYGVTDTPGCGSYVHPLDMDVRPRSRVSVGNQRLGSPKVSQVCAYP